MVPGGMADERETKIRSARGGREKEEMWTGMIGGNDKRDVN